jgi:hypothetical protein
MYILNSSIENLCADPLETLYGALELRGAVWEPTTGFV